MQLMAARALCFSARRRRAGLRALATTAPLLFVMMTLVFRPPAAAAATPSLTTITAESLHGQLPASPSRSSSALTTTAWQLQEADDLQRSLPRKLLVAAAHPYYSHQGGGLQLGGGVNTALLVAASTDSMTTRPAANNDDDSSTSARITTSGADATSAAQLQPAVSFPSSTIPAPIGQQASPVAAQLGASFLPPAINPVPPAIRLCDVRPC